MNDYHGHPAGRYETDLLAIDYLTEAGPRVVRLIPKALGRNLLAETPDAVLPSPHGPYHLYGGHRLWHAPESSAQTYVPEEGGLVWREVQDGVKLTRDEPLTGVRKELLLKVHPTEMDVQLYHRLTNIGAAPIELAPWAITLFDIGGTAVLPQHTRPLDPESLLPNRQLTLWPYTDVADPRLTLGNETIRIETRPIERPFKLGYLSRAGWLEYHTPGVVFRKEFGPEPERPHPDMGCNAEVYTNDKIIELETLGPLVTLAPGQTVEHFERWLIRLEG
jgi:hypothetical protein